MKLIDLRIDTVTKPCTATRKAMADMSGNEAALFLPSGTQSNLIALMTHCQQGDEYIVG